MGTTFLRRIALSAAIALAALFGIARVSWAQGYPARIITFVVPFPPGGTTDIVGRQVAANLSARIGQQVIVENKVGAGGSIGVAAVAKAAPDGYTMLLANLSPIAIGPALYKNVPYDPIKSFAPVIELMRGPFVLSVRASLPVNNVKELIDYAKKNPGKLNYGSPGQGTSIHLMSEILKQAAGIDMVHIPFKGGAAAWVAVASGDIDVMFDVMPGPLASLQSGKARAIAISGTKRLPALPAVPTFVEQGVQGVEHTTWFGVAVPAGTPKEIIAKLNTELNATLTDPEIKSAFAKQNFEPSPPGTPEEFGAVIARDVPYWRRVVERLGLKVE